MKKAFLLASALVLLSGSTVFANGEKDKNKGKKPASTEQTCSKPCPKPCPPASCDKSKCCKG